MAGLAENDRSAYESAKKNLKKVLDLQKLPRDEIEKDKPRVRANLVTHNSAGLLAVLSAKTGDCGGYWKYREMTRDLAMAEWSINLNGEIQRQDDEDDKKTKKRSIVEQTARAVVGLEYLCPRAGVANELPIKNYKKP